MADNDTYVQVQPNSTGARVDCTLLDNGNVRQTVVIGDPTGSSNVALIIGGTLAAADVLDIGVGSPDNAGYFSIIGDPSGDFAGVNLLETLMDDASGLGLGVRILNQPKVGPDGALQITDGKRIDIAAAASGNIIIDTLGYQQIQITTQGYSAGTIQFSNDLLTWTTGSVPSISNISQGFLSALFVNSNQVIPCYARYVRFTNSTAGTAVAYLRSAANFGYPNSITVTDITQWGNANTLTGGINGSVGIGGLAAAGALASTGGNPLPAAGVDYKNTIRNLTTDIYGSLVLSGWRLPLQPDTKTTNPLPAFTPPPPVKVSHTDDSPGPDTPGLLDSLRLMTALLASIDRRLQELPGNIANTKIDTDDFNASDVLSLIN